MPSAGGGRPPKLDADQQHELLELLRDGQPWKSREIQHLFDEEFDVEYHPDYLGTFLRGLGLSYVKSGSKRLARPEDRGAEAEQDDESFDKRDSDDVGGWVVDDDI